MTSELVLSLVQLSLAVMCGTLTLSSGFSLVLGRRHHHTGTRTRDLRLAAADTAVFLAMTVALLVDDLTTGLLFCAPFIAAFGYLVFIQQSAKAEARIARSVRTATPSQA